MVDLGGSYSVNLIKIFGRTDCCMERLGDYNVIILDSNQAQVWSDHQTSNPNPLTTIAAGGQTGRYVKVQLTGTNALSLAEVQVFDTTRNTLESIALPPINATIVSAACLTGGTPVVEQDTAGITISIPVQDVDSLYTIIKMALDYSRPVNGERVRVNAHFQDDITSICPNPFFGSIHFRYSLTPGSNSVYRIYNLRGQVVFTHGLAAGPLGSQGSFEWGGRDWQGGMAPPGCYLGRLDGKQGERFTNKLMLLR
jgi:hypothetical protein